MSPATLRQRIHDSERLHVPPLFDIVLAAVLTLTLGMMGDPFSSYYSGPDLVALVAGLLMTAPLALRRTQPLAMLALMTVAGVLQLTTLSGPSPSLMAVPIAAYSIARWLPGSKSRIVIYLGLIASALGPATWVFVQSGASFFSSVPAFSMLFITCFAAVAGPYLLGRRILEATQAASERQLASQAAYQAEISRREQETRITEARVRSEIARELHDVVAHSLSVIIVQADGGKALTAKKPEAAAEALETIAETGREALTEMRRIVGVLRNDPNQRADFAPNPSLIDIPAMVAKAGDRVELHVDGAPPLVPATLGLTAYRVVQEAVTNFLKHAGPDAHARVSIAYSPNAIDIEVADNGHGASASSDGAGHGLRGMYERVSSMGGRLNAGPGLGGGYLVRASLPLPTGPQSLGSMPW